MTSVPLEGIALGNPYLANRVRPAAVALLAALPRAPAKRLSTRPMQGNRLAMLVR